MELHHIVLSVLAVIAVVCAIAAMVQFFSRSTVASVDRAIFDIEEETADNGSAESTTRQRTLDTLSGFQIVSMDLWPGHNSANSPLQLPVVARAFVHWRVVVKESAESIHMRLPTGPAGATLQLSIVSPNDECVVHMGEAVTADNQVAAVGTSQWAMNGAGVWGQTSCD